MATPRGGKPYLHVTWLAKMLGGYQCRWSLWFRSRHKYEKYEVEAMDLVRWSREHNQMMRDRRAELEEAGWSVASEEQNEFKLEGQSAVIAGKPDIVATMPGHVLIIDGKTGRERDSDWFQVLLYLWAYLKARPDVVGQLEGEVHYKRGDKRVPVSLSELTPQRIDDIVKMIKIVDTTTPPPKSPSRDECRRCNVGFSDCPERYRDRVQQAALATEF